MIFKVTFYEFQSTKEPLLRLGMLIEHTNDFLTIRQKVRYHVKLFLKQNCLFKNAETQNQKRKKRIIAIEKIQMVNFSIFINSSKFVIAKIDCKHPYFHNYSNAINSRSKFD